MKQITVKNENDLPKWYNLDKYKPFRKLNNEGWYYALVQRACHLELLESFAAVKSKKYHTSSLIQKNIKALREDPLFSPEDNEALDFFGGTQMWAMKKRRAEFKKMLFSIKPITLNDIYQKERFVENDTRIKTRHLMDSYYESKEHNLSTEDVSLCEEILRTPLFEVLKTRGNYKPNHATRTFMRSRDMVEIDFSQPDHVLKSQFETYIKSTRKNFPDLRRSFAFKRPKYKAWCDFGIIPYLDLRIWALEHTQKISNRVLADAIFEDPEKDEESVRRSTQRIAKKITSNDYLQFMICLVAEEQT
ncbi:MAG: hypothetical protein CMH30_07705 [Micavibrio sp.]|nr:hypothetical protein [Micavibrio sp.]|tara:strand:- start:1229 stop:2140 length:912 start_codon:yes stop_codon:yes gene_type:complete